MPMPIALCLEDLHATVPTERYLRCVALVGRQPGLRLRGDGSTSWQAEQDAACELWVSADDRLILYRRSPAVDVRVLRSGRSLAPPCDKPVVLLDGDELRVGPRHLKIHVHGAAPHVAAPSPLPTRVLAQAMGAAAVLAMGAAVAGCDKDAIEVRQHPPDMEVVERDGGVAAPPTAVTTATASATATASEVPPIEVREVPPAPPPMPTLTSGTVEQKPKASK